MRIAVGQFSLLTEERLKYAAQMGVSGVVLNTPEMPGKRWEHFDVVRGKGQWHYLDLVELKTGCENYGLALEAIENVPTNFLDKAMLGLPGRDEQIEDYQEIIRNFGRAGIPVLGYHWIPNLVWRTTFTKQTRGGALVSAFDFDAVKNAPLTHGRVFTEDDMWANFEYFIKAVLPVAEEWGVTLALHPDDPPVPTLGGIARIMRNFGGFKRAMDMGNNSPNHGLDMCLGCWSEMGEDLPAVIEHFGSRGQITYVHFRDVQGVGDCFNECFLGEGNFDPFQIMLALKRSGFNGFIIDDHTPKMVDDTEWGHRGRALETGFLKGLLAGVNAMTAANAS